MVANLVVTKWYRTISFCSSLLCTIINPRNNVRGNQRKTPKGGKRKLSCLGTPAQPAEWHPSAAPSRPSVSHPYPAGEDISGRLSIR